MKRQPIDYGTNVSTNSMEQLTMWANTLLENRADENAQKVSEHDLSNLPDLKDLLSRPEKVMAIQRSLGGDSGAKFHYRASSSTLIIGVNQFVLDEHLEEKYPQEFNVKKQTQRLLAA